MLKVSVKTHLVWLALGLIWLGGCSKSEFAESSSQTSPPPAPIEPKRETASQTVDSSVSVPSPSPEPPPPLKELPPECNASGITEATLLTPTVANGKLGNYIEYLVSLTDCLGQRRTLTAEAILFDIDGRANIGLSDSNSLAYTLTAEGTTIRGELVEVSGSDLFGTTKVGYFHNETDKPVTVSTATRSIKIRIDLLGRVYSARSSSTSPTPAPTATNQPLPTFVIPTYLRFGKAEPVRKDVTFSANP